MDRGDRNQTEGDRHEPGRFKFLPHALEDVEPRNVTEELLRATVEEPDSYEASRAESLTRMRPARRPA